MLWKERHDVFFSSHGAGWLVGPLAGWFAGYAPPILHKFVFFEDPGYLDTNVLCGRHGVGCQCLLNRRRITQGSPLYESTLLGLAF